MKKIFFLITILFLILTPTSFAQEATKSSLTDKIKERLDVTAQQGLEFIKEELTSKSNLPKKKAYLGAVTNISDNLITLEYKGQSKKIKADDQTEYSKTKLSEIETDDFLIVMGFLFKDQEELTAKRITLINTPQPPVKRQLVQGKVKEVDGNKVVVNNSALPITSKTKLKVNGIENPDTEDIQLEDNLFSIVTLDKNGDIDDVKSVLVVPGKNSTATLEPTNADATDSAQATESSQADVE